MPIYLYQIISLDIGFHEPLYIIERGGFWEGYNAVETSSGYWSGALNARGKVVRYIPRTKGGNWVE